MCEGDLSGNEPPPTRVKKAVNSVFIPSLLFGNDPLLPLHCTPDSSYSTDAEEWHNTFIPVFRLSPNDFTSDDYESESDAELENVQRERRAEQRPNPEQTVLRYNSDILRQLGCKIYSAFLSSP